MNAGRGYTAGMKRRLVLVPFVLLALAACGNKGPLMHPTAPVEDVAVPATSTLPADATLPTPASTTPATSAEPTVPPNPDGGG